MTQSLKAVIETERLALRAITHDDFADLFSIWSDPEAMRMFPRTLDEAATREWIDRNLRRYEKYGHGLWAVILKDGRQFVGDCGLVIQRVDEVEELEVGYHFNPKFWGRGYATEAARACMDYARDRLGRRRIISMIRPENLPSRRVAERNGLRIEREVFWRGYQHYVYAKELS
jgi:[ribosomal protein S5]-alanine N-acetyltransferase